jgi:hypothetical protein
MFVIRPNSRRSPRSSPTVLVAFLSGVAVLSGCAAGAAPSSLVPSATPSPTVAPSDPPPTPTVAPTPTPVPTPEPITSTDATFSLLAVDQPAGFESTIVCAGDIGPSDPVAVVAMKTGEEFVTSQELRDYADIDEPRTACTFGEGNFIVADLIDARHVVIASDGIYAVVDLPEVTYHWFALPQSEDAYVNLLAVSPSLDAVLWTRERTVPDPFEIISRELMVTSDAGDAVVAELPEVEGGRCGSPTDSNPADYQLRGGHYYALDQILPSVNALVVASGSATELEHKPPTDGEWSADGDVPLFPVWSPSEEVLYYRLGNDVMRWTPEAGEEVFLADTPWFYPSMTSDGRYLAYVVDADLYLIDFAADASPDLIREQVNYPVFVNGSQLWFLDASSGGCATGDDPPERIYDVRDASEAPSVIQYVQGVWPQTSSNH